LSQLISEDVRKKEELRVERERRERELDYAENEALELREGGERKCKVKVRQADGTKAESVVKFGLMADGGEFRFSIRSRRLAHALKLDRLGDDE